MIIKERKFKFTISEIVKYKNGDTGNCPIGSIIVKSPSATKAFKEAEKYFIGVDITLTSPKFVTKIS
jgi:hypothetical protein